MSPKASENHLSACCLPSLVIQGSIPKPETLVRDEPFSASYQSAATEAQGSRFSVILTGQPPEAKTLGIPLPAICYKMGTRDKSCILAT